MGAVLGLVALAIILFLVAGPATLGAARSCRVCHVPAVAYAEWQKSSHSSVRCEQCHTDRAYLAGVGNSVALASDAWKTLRGKGTSDTVRVSDEACVACHPRAGLEKPVEVNGLRMSHSGLAAGGYRCTDCHAGVAHKLPSSRVSGPTMSTCARCHNNVTVSGACSECHSEPKSTDQARRSDPEWSKTHGPDWKRLHGMGDLSTCRLCHEPSKCEKCHGLPLPHDEAFISQHAGAAKTAEARCLSCHTRSFCDNCHGIPMPHPVGFLADHPKTATSDSDPRCMRCHVELDCKQCHAAHVHPKVGGAR